MVKLKTGNVYRVKVKDGMEIEIPYIMRDKPILKIRIATGAHIVLQRFDPVNRFYWFFLRSKRVTILFTMTEDTIKNDLELVKNRTFDEVRHYE